MYDSFSRIYLSYYNLKYISETEVLGEYSGGFERSNYDPDFTIHKFIKYYNFQSSFSYHIENPNEIFEIQKHLNFLLQTIDINLFIAKKIRLGVRIGWIGNNLNEGFADIILDNSLIDIKSGVKINGKKTENISQLLFYFFMIKLTVKNHKINQNDKIDDIKKIGFYFTAYNKLIEVDVNQLIPNLNKILKIIKLLLIQGNISIRDIIKHSISKENKQIQNFIDKQNAFEAAQKNKFNKIDLEIKKIEDETKKQILELKEKTEKLKEKTEKRQTQLKLIKEFRELGLSNEEIMKLLGF